MRVLALDTTTREGSVAIVDGDDVIVEHVGDPRRSHAERLPTDLLVALEASRLTLAQIELLAIATGPGLFTGLRIGIATIQGLAFVTGTRVVPISALEALAESASRDVPPGAVVGAWMDAHRRDVFSALYRVSGGPPFAVERLIEIDSAAVGDPADTLARWEALGSMPSVLAGDGAILYADRLRSSRTQTMPPLPLASIVARMAAARGRAGRSLAPSGVHPLYVRRPDVEIARGMIHGDGHEGPKGRGGR